MTAGERDLQQVRASIDRIDREIVQLLASREQLVRQAGKLKADAREVRSPARVEQVIAPVRATAEQAGASPDVVEQTYRAMIAAFIDLELGMQTTPTTATTTDSP